LMLFKNVYGHPADLPHPPTRSPAKLESGRQVVIKSPLHRMETYAQHTRDYRGEVNPARVPTNV
jgi:hypothetical protein